MEFHSNFSLIKRGFKQSMVDPSLFTKKEKDVFVALTVYIDDLILASNSKKAIKDVKDYLHSCFSIKDLGKLK